MSWYECWTERLVRPLRLETWREKCIEKRSEVVHGIVVEERERRRREEKENTKNYL